MVVLNHESNEIRFFTVDYEKGLLLYERKTDQDRYAELYPDLQSRTAGLRTDTGSKGFRKT